MSAAAARIHVARFSTDAIAPRERHDAWANRDWPTVAPAFDTRPTGAFFNRSDRFALGRLTVHLSEIGGQRYVRDAARVRADEYDSLFAQFMLAGTSRADSNGRSAFNPEQGALLTDLAQPHAHESTDSRTILLSIPREVATAAGFDVTALHGTVIAPSDAALVSAHLQQIHRSLPDLTVTQGARLAGSVVDLLGIALERAGGIAPGLQDRRGATLVAAKHAIEARLGLATLTTDWLCGHLKIGRTALFQLFAEEGGLHTYIRRRRLGRVRDALLDPQRGAALTVLADQWGFSDAAHLTRAFRAEFTMTPGEFRQQRARSERATA